MHLGRGKMHQDAHSPVPNGTKVHIPPSLVAQKLG